MSSVKKIQLYKVENGEWITTFPMGYELEPLKKRTKFSEKQTVFLNEEKASIVKDMFDKYASGHFSLLTLTKYLNEQYSSHKFHRATVHRMLMNPFYYGEMIFNGKLYPHCYPTIITKELYDEAQRAMQFNNKYGLYEKIKKPIEYIKQVKKTDTILSYLKNARSIEQVMEKFSLSFDNAQSIIIDMEMEGLIREGAGGLWKLK
jgi:hypothetical protein